MSCGQAHLIGLDSGSHSMDMMYRRICKMGFKIMTQEKNNKMKQIR